VAQWLTETFRFAALGL